MSLKPLLPHGDGGGPDEPAELVAGVITAMRQVYWKHGYEPPWVGYWGQFGGECVGTCGYKSPPVAGRVEIAYFTFPEFELRGHGARMAAELVRIAREADPALIVIAHTLPKENPSTSILRKLQFQHLGPVDDPEDGIVWRWELPPAG